MRIALIYIGFILWIIGAGIIVTVCPPDVQCASAIVAVIIVAAAISHTLRKDRLP